MSKKPFIPKFVIVAFVDYLPWVGTDTQAWHDFLGVVSKHLYADGNRADWQQAIPKTASPGQPE